MLMIILLFNCVFYFVIFMNDEYLLVIVSLQSLDEDINEYVETVEKYLVDCLRKDLLPSYLSIQLKK